MSVSSVSALLGNNKAPTAFPLVEVLL